MRLFPGSDLYIPLRLAGGVFWSGVCEFFFVMPQQSSIIHNVSLVTKTLDTLAVERNNFDRSFGLVDEVIREFGEADLANRLYEAIPRGRPWQDIADMFGILIWSTSDNGHALTSTTEQWLRDTTDVRQVQIALHLDVFPFMDRATMEQVLSKVAATFPEVAQRCRELTESRRRLLGGGA